MKNKIRQNDSNTTRTKMKSKVTNSTVTNSKSNDNIINKRKAEYEQYEAPPELKERMEEAMKRAHKENESKKKIIFFTKCIGGTGIAAMLALTILTNSSANIAYALEKIPVLGEFTKVVTFRTYEDRKENFEAKIDVPQIEDTGKASENVNKQIKEYTDQLILQYEKDIEELGVTGGHESMDTSYEVITDNKDIFSLRIDTVISRGSSDQFSKFYTIDKKTDEIMELKDLFKADADYIKVLNDTIISQMREQMKQDENKIYFIDQTDGMSDQFTSINENQNYYINKDGQLVIAFDKYIITPGYMGAPEFIIPTDIIQSILKTDTILK